MERALARFLTLLVRLDEKARRRRGCARDYRGWLIPDRLRKEFEFSDSLRDIATRLRRIQRRIRRVAGPDGKRPGTELLRADQIDGYLDVVLFLIEVAKPLFVCSCAPGNHRAGPCRCGGRGWVALASYPTEERVPRFKAVRHELESRCRQEARRRKRLKDKRTAGQEGQDERRQA